MIKINNLPKPLEIATAKPALDEVTQRRLKLKKATQAFESIFIAQLLKSMRSSSLDTSDKEENGFGKDIMMSVADESVASQLSKTGMLGIGDVLYKHLLKRLDEADPESPGLKITAQRHIDGIAPPRSIKSTSDIPAQERHDVSGTVTPTESGTALPKGTSRPVKPPDQPQPVPSKPRSEAADAVRDRLGKYVEHIHAAAKETRLPENLLRAMIMQESSGDQGATSHRGAAGLMQLMPDTARTVGVKNLYDPGENIMGGARYLRKMLDRFGDLETALAAYNAGPGNIEKHGGVPPFAETQDYVKRVLAELSGAKQVNKSSFQTDIEK